VVVKHALILIYDWVLKKKGCFNLGLFILYIIYISIFWCLPEPFVVTPKNHSKKKNTLDFFKAKDFQLTVSQRVEQVIGITIEIHQYSQAKPSCFCYCNFAQLSSSFCPLLLDL